MTCSTCTLPAIVLYRTWDERGICLGCCKEAAEAAESAAIMARLERYLHPRSDLPAG